MSVPSGKTKDLGNIKQWDGTYTDDHADRFEAAYSRLEAQTKGLYKLEIDK
jgi:hypothetical protein